MAAAALKAARGLIRDFGEVEQLQVSIKGPGDFVSNADLKADRTLRGELTRARPGYGLLFEESGAVEGSDKRHRWIVDPLDGTTNFLHGIPHFAISIGLERDGEIVAGVVYEPTRDELYWAEKGAGAYLNDRRLRVSARRQLAEAVIATGLRASDRDKPQYFAIHEAVTGNTAGVRLIWRRRTRPCLCRGRAARGVLGIRPQPVGYRRRHPSGARGGRLCQRPFRRPDDADERRHPGRQRPSAPAACGAGTRDVARFSLIVRPGPCGPASAGAASATADLNPKNRCRERSA